MSKRFDYIIIGAGSAGCVLANRLSKDKKNTVCVLESGPKSNSWKVDMPSALLYTMHDPKMIWKYSSEFGDPMEVISRAAIIDGPINWKNSFIWG